MRAKEQKVLLRAFARLETYTQRCMEFVEAGNLPKLLVYIEKVRDLIAVINRETDHHLGAEAVLARVKLSEEKAAKVKTERVSQVRIKRNSELH